MQGEEKLDTTSRYITEWDTESNAGEVGRYFQRTVVLPIRNLILPERYRKELKQV